MTRFALQNPVAVTLFFSCVVMIGLTAWFETGRSILPPVSLPIVSVRAACPGAGPMEIERLVIEPLEDQFDLIPDVDRVFASAQNGVANITVRFRFGSNLDVDRSNVQQAVDSARPNIPADLIPHTAGGLQRRSYPGADPGGIDWIGGDRTGPADRSGGARRGSSAARDVRGRDGSHEWRAHATVYHSPQPRRAERRERHCARFVSRAFYRKHHLARWPFQESGTRVDHRHPRGRNV